MIITDLRLHYAKGLVHQSEKLSTDASSGRGEGIQMKLLQSMDIALSDWQVVHFLIFL